LAALKPSALAAIGALHEQPRGVTPGFSAKKGICAILACMKRYCF
jgi:hypothetical protein